MGFGLMMTVVTTSLLAGCSEKAASQPLSVLSTAEGTTQAQAQTERIVPATVSVASIEPLEPLAILRDSTLSQAGKPLQVDTLSKNSSALQDEALQSAKTLGTKLNAPINDFTNTLTKAERDVLADKIVAIYEEDLLQIGVVLVPTTADLSTFDYAMAIAQGWQLGSPDNNNGVLILIAKEDRAMHILTGLDVEDTIIDEDVQNIIDDVMTPYFAKNDFALGLSLGIDALADDMRDGRAQ